MDEKKYILSNDEIWDLISFTGFEEGDPVCFMEDGEPCGGFWALAEQVVNASAAQAARLEAGQARALFYMRSFYLLGVIRGAEAYRFSMLDTDDEEGQPVVFFTPDDGFENDFREGLERLPPELFQRLCALLGLSVQWEK